MNFTIEQLERNADGGVKVVHWRVSKTSGENTASDYGTCNFFPDSTAEDFIAFDSLTEANVIAWVEADLDTADIESNLDANLAELETPTTITGTPWE